MKLSENTFSAIKETFSPDTPAPAKDHFVISLVEPLETGRIHVAVGANRTVFSEWLRRQNLTGVRVNPRFVTCDRDFRGLDPQKTTIHLLDGYQTSSGALCSAFSRLVSCGARCQIDPEGYERTLARAGERFKHHIAE